MRFPLTPGGQMVKGDMGGAARRPEEEEEEEEEKQGYLRGGVATSTS